MAAGNSYEVLTQQIFQTILDQTLVQTVAVQRNVWLQGKGTTHQVDVYWRFEVGGIPHETIIQAKDWSKAVDQGELLKFRGVLDDLPGQPRGVFVTRTGYQSGAEDIARLYGILLLQLEEVQIPPGPFELHATNLGYVHVRVDRTPLSLEGAARQGWALATEFIVYEPEYTGQFNVDPNWLRETFGPDEDAVRRQILAGRFDDMKLQDAKLYDCDGNEVNDAQAICKGFVDTLRGRENAPVTMCHTFDAPTYHRLPNSNLPPLRTLSFSATMTLKETARVRRPMRIPNVVQFLLRNLTAGTERVHGRPSNP